MTAADAFQRSVAWQRYAMDWRVFGDPVRFRAALQRSFRWLIVATHKLTRRQVARRLASQFYRPRTACQFIIDDPIRRAAALVDPNERTR